MVRQSDGPQRFGVAEHGVRWAVAQLPEGRVENGCCRVGQETLTLEAFPAAKGPDDYAVRFGEDGPRVLANSAVGAISGILKLGDLLRGGRRRDFTAHLRFRTRNYKHEPQLARKAERWVGHCSEDMWEALCRELVSHQFNGLVFYAGYHPFEYILDYQECPEAASQDEASRTATREAVQRALAMAHRYGLKTFMQHYVGHFTKELADLHGIPTTGRHSNTAHPEVEKYCRYCYRGIFRQLPDLDGLYFNFESYANAHEHVLATAIPEFNRMARKPIAVFRLWEFTSFDGMRRMLRAYRGRVILGHKVMDTNDAYYLPVADSRVMEWKKRLGRDVEWMFLVGPCHNCGTNLCQQLWSDYDFVQALLADAEAKGADSISFHTVAELFCAGLPDPRGLFTENERNLSRFNRLHVLAAADYANGVRRTPAARASTLAELNSVPHAAGRHLYSAVLHSSQLILLVYRQFYLSSAAEGYLNDGRNATIQEPFYFMHASELSHQSRKLAFKGWAGAWVPKTIDTVVAPDGEYQYIVDSINPALPTARLSPARIAALLERNARQSRAALAAYRRTAGQAAAARLEPYIQRNALVGGYVACEIRAARQLYSLYFARNRAAAGRAIRRGLAELRAAARLVPDRTAPEFKQLARVTMINMNPDVEVRLAKELLRWWTTGRFPMAAFAAYVESHRQFNEIRRVIRPGRPHGPAHIRHARACLAAAERSADAAIAAAEKDSRSLFHVRAWREYLEQVRRDTTPPQATCDGRDGTPLLPLHHDDCFRAGYDFMEDFVSFFRPVDFARPARLSVQVSRTRTELVVRLHEGGVGLDARRPRWVEYHGEGSDSFVLRVFVDVNGDGRRGDVYIVWPVGGGISRGPQAGLPGRVEARDTGDGWDLIAHLPFAVLGRTPRPGDTWGFNVTSNPFVTRNTAYTWASQYDSHDPRLYGRLRFA